MFKKLAIASAIALTMISSVQAEEDKSQASNPIVQSIAVVNVPLILNDIPQAKASAEALRKEFGPREAELQKLDDEGKSLSQKAQSMTGDELTNTQRKLAQMESEFRLKLQAFQEDQRKRNQEENVKLLSLVQKAIDTIAKERGLQMVLRGESVVYATQAVDISQEVISRVTKMGTNDNKSDKKTDKK